MISPEKLLPVSIDPVRLAREGVNIEGELALAQCPRLQAIHPQGEALAQVSLRFFKDEAGFYAVTGQVCASVHLRCERCGEPMCFDLKTVVSLSPIVSEKQAPSLPGNYEPLVTGGEPVDTAALIEEEILLGLPMVPKHAENECLSLD